MVDQTAPQFGGLVKIGKPGWEGVPDGESPFYVGAYDGLWAHRRMLIGRGMAKVDYWPKSYSAFGAKDLDFLFEAPPIPALLMGQIVNFFERIYDRQHTEAAVLLVMHTETKEWRVFVPTQLVSHGGVNYVFEPSHIQRPWVIVGSIHSHCDFGAGHSSTDTGDADGFDGLHCTIGMIKRDIPQIVAMVAMNKKLKHFKEDEFPTLFDFSEPKQHEAPAWWDRYVEDTRTKTKPVGFHLYEKYQKSTLVKTEAKSSLTKITPPSKGYQPTGYNAADWHYHEGLKRMVHKDWVIDPETLVVTYPNGHNHTNRSGLSVVRKPEQNERFSRETMTGAERRELMGWLMRDEIEDYSISEMTDMGFEWDEAKGMWTYSNGITNESREFNARRMAERGVRWHKDGSLLPSEDAIAMRSQGDRYWEDEIDPAIRDVIFDSTILDEDDFEWALRHPDRATQLEEWQTIFYKKALSAVESMNALGMNIALSIGHSEPPKDIEIILLPEPKAQQHQQGAN